MGQVLRDRGSTTYMFRENLRCVLNLVKIKLAKFYQLS